MKPSEVRARVLAEHDRIRTLLAELEALVRRYEKGDRDVHESLRDKGLELHDFLCEHLDLEDHILADALRRADAWGEERADRLSEEHREQRALLGYLLSRLRDANRPTILMARELQNFADLLRVDMEHEESTELSDRVLRDDVIAIDMETG